MALVVFMRAVNIGAAGTFVVRARVSEKSLRKKMLAEMGFEPAMMVCAAADVIDLVRAKPFGTKLSRNVKGFVSIMERPLREPPNLPVDQPQGSWGVRIIAVDGRFALSFWR